MEKIWVLVADANRARYFETDSPTGDLRETTDMVHPESRLHERAIRTDKPGRAFDRSGQGRHALSERESIREQSAIAFAIEIADHLDNARTKHSFDRLIVVAPPKFLGELRERLDDNVRDLITLELDKDLAHIEKAAEIRTHLPERL